MNLIKFASSPASEKKQESSIRPRKTTSINAQLGRPKEFAFRFWVVFKFLKKAVCAGIICSIAFFPALAAFWRLGFSTGKWMSRWLHLLACCWGQNRRSDQLAAHPVLTWTTERWIRVTKEQGQNLTINVTSRWPCTYYLHDQRFVLFFSWYAHIFDRTNSFRILTAWRWSKKSRRSYSF